MIFVFPENIFWDSRNSSIFHVWCVKRYKSFTLVGTLMKLFLNSFELWLMNYDPKMKKSKFLKITPNNFKFSHMVNFWGNQITLKRFNLVISNVTNLSFHVRLWKPHYDLNKKVFHLWLKYFENRFTQFWFIDGFKLLSFRFCHNVIWALTPLKIVHLLKFAYIT